MKKILNVICAVVAAILLLACGQKEDAALERSVALLAKFNCSITPPDRFAKLMAEDKRRAEVFIDLYRRGMHTSTMSIDAVVENQLKMYQEACSANYG